MQNIQFLQSLYPRFTWIVDYKGTGISIETVIRAWYSQKSRLGMLTTEDFARRNLSYDIVTDGQVETFEFGETDLDRIGLRSDYTKEDVIIPLSSLIKFGKRKERHDNGDKPATHTIVTDRDVIEGFVMENAKEDTSEGRLLQVFGTGRKLTTKAVIHLYEKDSKLFADVYRDFQKTTVNCSGN